MHALAFTLFYIRKCKIKHYWKCENLKFHKAYCITAFKEHGKFEMSINLALLTGMYNFAGTPFSTQTQIHMCGEEQEKCPILLNYFGWKTSIALGSAAYQEQPCKKTPTVSEKGQSPAGQVGFIRANVLSDICHKDKPEEIIGMRFSFFLILFIFCHCFVTHTPTPPTHTHKYTPSVLLS